MAQPVAQLPTIVAGTTPTSKQVSRAVAAGILRPIALNLYTPDLTTPIPELTRTNWTAILAKLAPEAVVSYRTALEGMPAPDGSVFLSGATRYEREIPGLIIRVVQGAGPAPGDLKNGVGLHVASEARALLDAARPSRRRGVVPRGLAPHEMEARLRNVHDAGGKSRLEEIQRQVMEIAPLIHAEAEARLLAEIIDDLTGAPASPTAGLERVIASLRRGAFRQAVAATATSFTARSIEDAHASHVLSGGRLTIDESRAALLDDTIPPGLDEDAAMLAGIHSIVGRRVLMARGIADDDDAGAFIARLAEWHSRIVSANGEIASELTPLLTDGYTRIRELERPFQRAMAVHALILAAHAFVNGNGRLARALMNAELASAGEARVIIPARDAGGYHDGVERLRRRGDVRALAELCKRAQTR